MLHRALSITASLALVVTAACHDDHEDHVSPAEDACEHMAEGPSQALTAADQTSADAPALDAEHTRFDITLSGDDGALGGYVNLVIDEAGEFYVYLDTNVPVALADAQGAAIAAEETIANVAECAEVSTGHVYDLGVGTYSLRFGPGDAATVRVVVVHAD